MVPWFRFKSSLARINPFEEKKKKKERMKIKEVLFNIWRVNRALVSPVGVRLIYNLQVENCYEENSFLQVLSFLFLFILRVLLSCFCPMTVCHNFVFLLYLQVLILPNALFFFQCITVINTSTSWLAINLIWIIQIILSDFFQGFWIGKCSHCGEGRNIFWFKKIIIIMQRFEIVFRMKAVIWI